MTENEFIKLQRDLLPKAEGRERRANSPRGRDNPDDS